ncbi:MAG: copper homeostasis protein CutC [Bacteroidetes bacterium]|nr:copper homeostasis protein CutC [Bacteroidota bacterium]
MKDLIFEIACFDYGSAAKAVNAGAHRIELCSSRAEGGVTPSISMIQKVRKDFNIKLHVIIRPRGGNFFYSNEEIEIMKNDIIACKNAGADGVVFGILTENNEINTNLNKELVSLAKPMSSTFHRAFDSFANPYENLEKVIACGFGRILTSGCKESAAAGINTIANLVKQAGNRIIIMPGGGIRRENVLNIAVKTGVKEIHSSSLSVVID